MPYTGATGAVNLGAYDLTVNTIRVGKGGGAVATNTVLGYQAGNGANSGSGQNTFIGYQSGKTNTTGSENVFLGYSSGFLGTTGLANVGLGNYALYSLVGTYNYNVAIGYVTLGALTTGANNVALGGQAGRFISGGTALTIANNSILIGYNTKPLADNQTNQTVIGYDATGLGSNTTVIGNSSTTFGRWYGRLLLGTSTDAGYGLDVNGTARVQGAITGTVALTSVAGSGVGNDFTTNHTVNTSASYIGTRFLSNVTTSAANTSTIIAQQANIKITSTTNLPSAIQGCQLSMDMNGASGTLGQITGITSGGVVANGATVSNVYHYQTLGMFTPSTGVVNNQYGFYYDEAYVTPSNRGYAFYSKVNPSGGTLASLTDISIIPASTKGVGISNAAITPAASAILDITSTTKGVLFPRMTLAQRTAIASPATGLIVYQTDGVEGLWLNTSTGWVELTVV